ncbi:MAG: HNH endonuclease [Lachnospiraceae bacterium]|nr:HNH endonuclease [Lachnospiraceae bacterium]
MSEKEKINLLYIDDDRDEAISAYLEGDYQNNVYDVNYQEIDFGSNQDYESLLDSEKVTSANVILIDSRLFENDSIRDKGKFSGEEFRMILRKVFPFIEVLVISQNGENKEFEIIPKYRSGGSETSREYYDRVLKEKIDESIKRVKTFRNISKKLVNNKGIEKFLIEKTVDSLNGINDYEDFGIYHKKFAKIYNNKCAYCGALWGLLPVESFEVDHFLNIASFPDTTDGRIEAGKMINLVWSCISCNRGKRGITIKPPYDNLLNTDNGNIALIFKRDSDYYIRICDTYQDDEFIKKFYESLHLGYETRRLDYLALQLEGKYRNEKDENRRQKLGESLSLLLQKRNRIVNAGRSIQ